uniref:Vitamin K-dependent protein C n=1 Tax=Strigamia maritima TaxID=126957 RepID=T1JL62_STRMM
MGRFGCPLFFWVKSAHDIAGLKAKLGKHDRTQSEAEEKVLNIDKMILHPDFDTNLRSFDNDIALIRLSERVTFSETIIPICLPAEGFVGSFYNARIARVAQAPHISGTVSGWGRLEEDGLQPKFLHQVRLPLVDYNLCKESTKQHVTENMFCAGYEQAVGDSCQGDSGGPFEMYVDGVAYLAGIVSWGEGCARPGTYGFYTKVENYRDFIAKHTGYDNDGKN